MAHCTIEEQRSLLVFRNRNGSAVPANAFPRQRTCPSGIVHPALGTMPEFIVLCERPGDGPIVRNAHRFPLPFFPAVEFPVAEQSLTAGRGVLGEMGDAEGFLRFARNDNFFHLPGHQVETVVREAFHPGSGKPDKVCRLVGSERHYPLAIAFKGPGSHVGIRYILEIREDGGLHRSIIRKDALEVMMRRLPSAVVLQGGPGWPRPDIVQLPHQNAVAIREGAPVRGGGLEADCLFDLG